MTADVPLPGLDGYTAPDHEQVALSGAVGPNAVYATARAVERRRQLDTFPHRVSEDRLLTAARRALVDAGYHPLTRLPLAGNGETCRTCRHLDGDVGRYRKCGRHHRTASRHTDVVLSWPACTAWEPR